MHFFRLYRDKSKQTRVVSKGANECQTADGWLGSIAGANSERQHSDPTAPTLETKIEDVAKGCGDGCSGCFALIALFLCCIGFFGLRAAFRGNPEGSDSGLEAKGPTGYVTNVGTPLLKSESAWSDHIESYFVRALKGVFGLVGGVLGIMILYHLYTPILPDKTQPPRRTKRSRPKIE